MVKIMIYLKIYLDDINAYADHRRDKLLDNDLIMVKEFGTRRFTLFGFGHSKINC